MIVHHCGARQLVVSSYQVGDGNDEGLDSGSFWFYYKLGFRPVRTAVRATAERERARVEADQAYRTSRANNFRGLSAWGALDDLPRRGLVNECSVTLRPC